MRERVPHLPRKGLPVGGGRRCACGARAVCLDPVRAGPTEHTAQQPFVGARLKQPGTIRALPQIDRAMPDRFRLLRGLLGQFGRRAIAAGKAGGLLTAKRRGILDVIGGTALFGGGIWLALTKRAT